MTTQQPDIPGTPGPITPDLEEHTALTHPDQPVAVPAPAHARRTLVHLVFECLLCHS